MAEFVSFRPHHRWAQIPVLRIAESFAEAAADAVQLGLVCRHFREKMWEASPSRRLCAPRLAVRGHTALENIRRVHPGSMRVFSADDAAHVFSPRGVDLLAEFFANALALEALHLRLRDARSQPRWGVLLERLGDAGGNSPRPPPLRSLRLEGSEFPCHAGKALGSLLRLVCASLREIVINFDRTSGGLQEEPIDDGSLWDSLADLLGLEALCICGLRTSEATCPGLTAVLTKHAKSLHTLELGRHTVSALVRTPSAAGEHYVSPELRDLLQAGAPLQLRKLALRDLEPPPGLGPLAVGFGPLAANLAALLQAAALLAPRLTELDLSGNAAVTRQQLPLETGFPDGRVALLSILEACGPLARLDISNSEIPLTEAALVLSEQARSLDALDIQGCALIAVQPDPRGLWARPVLSALCAFDHLRRLNLGAFGTIPALRQGVIVLLQECAPFLQALTAEIHVGVFCTGLSDMFTTGNCRMGGARCIEELDVVLTSPTCVASDVGRFVNVVRANGETLRELRIRAPLGDGLSAAVIHGARTAPLERLDLAACRLGPNAFRYLESARANWSTLSVLSLSRNHVGADGDALLKGLAQAPRLREVHLCSCGLEPGAAGALGRLLAAGSLALLLVDVACNPGLGPNGVGALVNTFFAHRRRASGDCRAAVTPSASSSPGGAALHLGAEEDASAPSEDAGMLPGEAPGALNLYGCGVLPEDHGLPSHLGRFELVWEGFP